MQLMLAGRCATVLILVSALKVIFTSGIFRIGAKSSPLSEATVAESAMEISMCCRRGRHVRKLGRRGNPRGELCGNISSGFGPMRRLLRAESLVRDSIASVAA